ncbi:tryptophan synthase alpha chain, partial [Pyxidicoccus sp. 3LFB2]
MRGKGQGWAGCWVWLLALWAVACTNTAAPPESLDSRRISNCQPMTCAAQGLDCGIAIDGCGGTLECGTCAVGDTCGGGGAPNVCGTGACSPTTCAALGKNCGPMSDGCGGMLDCGTCPEGQTCGGDAVPNVCGSGA